MTNEITPRQEDYRLRAGTYTSGSITSGYAVTAWTVQNDQKSVSGDTQIAWAAPVRVIPPQRQRQVITLDQALAEDGFLEWEWLFSYWTFDMLGYFHTTYVNGVLSAAVSVMVYNDEDTAAYYNATIHRPKAGQDMEPEIGGWKNVRIRFKRGSVTA